MYKILLFSGGVYRFKDLVETVEDAGGLVLRKDQFEISRGSSYLSNEIQVMLIVPGEDEKIVQSLSTEIRGRMEELDDADKDMIVTFLPIYNALCRASSWITLEEIEDLIQCPCLSSFCEKTQEKNCIIDELKETLTKLCDHGIVEKRDLDGKTQYRLDDDQSE